MQPRGISLALVSLLAFAPWVLGATCARDTAIIATWEGASAVLDRCCVQQCEAVGRTCDRSGGTCHYTDGRGVTTPTQAQRDALATVRARCSAEILAIGTVAAPLLGADAGVEGGAQ